MGNLYNGDAILKGSLTVESDKPLDSGSVVQGKEDLVSLTRNLYNGKLVVSVDDKALYMLKDRSKAGSLDEGWVKIASAEAIQPGDGSGGNNNGGDNGDDGNTGSDGNNGGGTDTPDGSGGLSESEVKELISTYVTSKSGTKRFRGFTDKSPYAGKAPSDDGIVVFCNITNKFCYAVPKKVEGFEPVGIDGDVSGVLPGDGEIADIARDYYAYWDGDNEYHSAANADGKDKVYIYDDGLYIFNDDGDFVLAIGGSESNSGGVPDNLDEIIREAVKEEVASALGEDIKETIKEVVTDSLGDNVEEVVGEAAGNIIKGEVTTRSGTERFYGFTNETPQHASAIVVENGYVVYSTAVNKFCYAVPKSSSFEPVPAADYNETDNNLGDVGIAASYYSNWNGADRYHSVVNEGGKDKIYIYNDTLYVFNYEGELVSTGRTEAELPENIQELINEAVKNSITIDESVTESGDNPVKSSGIFKAIAEKVDAKFVVISERDFNSLTKKDPNTFYFITQ